MVTTHIVGGDVNEHTSRHQLPGVRHGHERCRHKAGYKYGREKRHMCHWRDINKPPTKKGLIAAGGI